MTIEEIIVKSFFAKDQFWFIEAVEVIERTDSTITIHFTINTDLFIQIFLSERSSRLSFALIGKSGRLYGRDREHNFWHMHPFENPESHESTPEGMSPKPVVQFLTEVEEILVNNDLI
jgi:hypothetical protein